MKSIPARFILTIIMMVAGAIFGAGLAQPEAYAAPKPPAPDPLPLGRVGEPAIVKALAGPKQITFRDEKMIPVILGAIDWNLARLKPKDRMAPRQRDRLLGEIMNAGKKYNIDPLLITAVIWAESNFKVQATSYKYTYDSKGQPVKVPIARGLMQISKWLGPDNGMLGYYTGDPYDLAQNINAGTRYLADGLQLHKDLSLALAGYNAGHGSARHAIGHYSETRRYVPKVMGLYEQLQKASKGKDLQERYALAAGLNIKDIPGEIMAGLLVAISTARMGVRT